MKKLFLVAAVAVLLCLLLSVAASAQYDEESSKLNLKLGFFMPIGSTAKDIVSKSWSLEQLTYDSKRDETGRPIVQFNFGLMGSMDSDRSSIFTLGVDRFFWKASKGDSSLYYGFGAGLYKMKVHDKFRIVEAKKLNTGVDLFVGYNFHDAYMLELRGLLVRPITLGSGANALDVNLSGVMICASTRRLF